MEHKIAEKQKAFVAFKKEYGNAKVGEITVNQVVGGMHGMLAMIYQTSKLHPMMGINYRGHDLFEIMKRCPTSKGGLEPLPEAILWLLLTSEFPNARDIEVF